MALLTPLPSSPGRLERQVLAEGPGRVALPRRRATVWGWAWPSELRGGWQDGQVKTRLRSHFDPEVSRHIERLAARAWPADEVEEVEGWLLRRTVGVDRRRSNSLLPPADTAHAVRTLDLALATAEDLDFTQTIQVSPAESHLRLDEVLEDRGMTFSSPTLVLVGPLGGTASPPADISVRVTGGDPTPGPLASAPAMAVELGDLTAGWLSAWAAVSGIAGVTETADLVLSQLGTRARFATAIDPATSEALGVCIGVAESGWLGLFSLHVTPSARRRGIATHLVDTLSSWSTSAGATSTYLQVEADNEPALSFYASRGFHIAHSYHYRSA
jgi:ribosomal protein S18 acetylase RimI-like enzyme